MGVGGVMKSIEFALESGLFKVFCSDRYWAFNSCDVSKGWATFNGATFVVVVVTSEKGKK